MKIALIAHDKKKEELLKFIAEHLDFFSGHSLIATGTTGRLIGESTGLPVQRVMSGPLGGDQQIGSRIADGEVDLVFFLRDPLTAQPHEPDISALLRICDVYMIPVATNVGTAALLIKTLLN